IKKKYVYGIDPAIQGDNFAIVILEVAGDHWKVVYCWTTNKKDFRARHKIGQEIEHDYYAFCARKIRDLMKTFPCLRIGMDAQGGGRGVEEALHSPKNLEDKSNEQLIWPVKIEGKEQITDEMPGLHILELVEFANYNWV